MGEIDSTFIQELEHRPKLAIIEAQGIPQIDLSPLVNLPLADYNATAIQGLVDQVHDACKNWGFFQVINHGVPIERCEQLMSVAKKFFDQPVEEKRKVMRNEANPLGYCDTEVTKTVREWKEVFDFTAGVPMVMATEGDQTVEYANQWPNHPSELREACEEYVNAVQKLSNKLLKLISMSLNLSANRLEPFFKDQTAFVRLNHYPTCLAPNLALGAGRHKDAGALTILAQDDVGGLEVKRKTDGEWIFVKPVHNALIINLGDVMQVWSNDIYESIEHRVRVNSTRERFSIPFFMNPALYVVVEPLPELISIIHETIAPYTPQQNGVAKKKNKALEEMVNSMLTYSGLSEGFWEEAIAVVRLPDPKRKTLGEKVLIASLFDMLSIPRLICFIPKDVIPNSVESQRDDHSDDVPSETLEPRRGKRARKAKSYGYDFQLYLVEGSRDQKEEIDDEIGSIMENNTWALSDLPSEFRQKERIDYFDTYVPVSRITTIRLLLTLAVIHNLVIHQMDVKITFLNGDLDEEVYMKQPGEFIMSGNEHKFSMKYMGEADVILGIKIKRENKGIVITQSHYIEKILKKFNRDDCSPVSTLMDPVEKLKPNTGKPVDQLEYSRAIGCLMHAMTSTRPDIAYAVGRLSRFTSNPGRQHWQAITKVFKYLKGTMNYGLSYVGYPSVLEAYSDARWINHVEDSSSMSEWVFLLGGGAILWASKKQTCITGSTMEYEFVALAAAGKEAEWLRNLIHEIPIWPKPIAPISIRCDKRCHIG
ncbi:zinc finger, CCHC-type containing protein [Tanacetum coccineum]